jgi:hypothetical protein
VPSGIDGTNTTRGFAILLGKEERDARSVRSKRGAPNLRESVARECVRASESKLQKSSDGSLILSTHVCVSREYRERDDVRSGV